MGELSVLELGEMGGLAMLSRWLVVGWAGKSKPCSRFADLGVFGASGDLGTDAERPDDRNGSSLSAIVLNSIEPLYDDCVG